MFTIPVSHIPGGCLTVGDEIAGCGTIEHVSMTAYLIDGAWVPFRVIHGGRRAVAGLVAFADGSVFGGAR